MPGDAPPSSAADQYAGGMASFRDTAKWIVGGVTASVAGVLVGTPLTHLGELAPGERLYLAIGAAVLALASLGVLMSVGIGVITAQMLTINELAGQTGWLDVARRKGMEKTLLRQFPLGVTSFQDLSNKVKGALTEKQKNEVVAFLEPMAFEYKRRRFLELFWTTLVVTPVAALLIGTYAWAATPESPPAALSESPRVLPISADTEGVAALAPLIDSHCFVPAGPGRFEVKAVVVAEYPGWTDLLVPPTGDCPAVRVRQQNGHLFPGK